MDVYIEEEGERVVAQANTENGSEFVDGWTGALLEVIDSGRIVVPREALGEFTAAALQRGLLVSSGEAA